MEMEDGSGAVMFLCSCHLLPLCTVLFCKIYLVEYKYLYVER